MLVLVVVLLSSFTAGVAVADGDLCCFLLSSSVNAHHDVGEHSKLRSYPSKSPPWRAQQFQLFFWFRCSHECLCTILYREISKFFRRIRSFHPNGRRALFFFFFSYLCCWVNPTHSWITQSCFLGHIVRASFCIMLPRFLLARIKSGIWALFRFSFFPLFVWPDSRVHRRLWPPRGDHRHVILLLRAVVKRAAKLPGCEQTNRSIVSCRVFFMHSLDLQP